MEYRRAVAAGSKTKVPRSTARLPLVCVQANSSWNCHSDPAIAREESRFLWGLSFTKITGMFGSLASCFAAYNPSFGWRKSPRFTRLRISLQRFAQHDSAISVLRRAPHDLISRRRIVSPAHPIAPRSVIFPFRIRTAVASTRTGRDTVSG
jgi:hypothetical protein